MKPWLIGENNPYGADPRFALYCEPEYSAGGRLCRKVLGLEPREYLRRYVRRNLLQRPKWSTPAAREAAKLLLREIPDGSAVILLGARVARAFGVEFKPFAVFAPADLKSGHRFAVLPHPSGLCRVWNEPRAFERAREAVRLVEEVAS